MPRARGLVVVVDGPSGSGKSTLCRRAAAALGAGYLDTGAYYRAVCWAALEDGLDLSAGAAAEAGGRDHGLDEAVAGLARGLDLRVGTDPERPFVVVRGTDVTAAIRESRISSAVSVVATNLEVRAELIARQRAAIAAQASARGVVAEGRDLTTVVAPEAAVRVLVVVDEQRRLARRALELHGTSDAAAVERTRDEVVRRDRDDSSVAAFTEAADGVSVLDNSGSLEEGVEALLALATAALGERITQTTGART
ncbi:cytidylate kinase [Quadrisphaera granulorum]|uniref:Cytidylate kinase n=1 Tax=Quadrisphaera granulorum TaxID=317664 RepID=A0A316ABQ3_9ACTN|nr:cytidylate kinase [Quadrisphaera granulorum]SZE96050.1 cytidylate kinase [Quadrisphaera granulorum]